MPRPYYQKLFEVEVAVRDLNIGDKFMYEPVGDLMEPRWCQCVFKIKHVHRAPYTNDVSIAICDAVEYDERCFHSKADLSFDGSVRVIPL